MDIEQLNTMLRDLPTGQQPYIDAIGNDDFVLDGHFTLSELKAIVRVIEQHNDPRNVSKPNPNDIMIRNMPIGTMFQVINPDSTDAGKTFERTHRGVREVGKPGARSILSWEPVQIV